MNTLKYHSKFLLTFTFRRNFWRRGFYRNWQSFYTPLLTKVIMSCNCLKRSANLCCVTVIFTFIWIVQADVLVVSRHSNVTINAFADLPASFGKVLPFEGLQGCVISANPPQACKAIDPPPQRSNCSEKWFVLIKRYECNFVDKVRSAQQAGFDAAIVYNIGSNLIGTICL